MIDTSARDERLPHENKAATNETPAKHGRYGCIVVVGLAVMMLGFGLWYACLRSVPLRISPETTYITEPLQKDGRRVDYLAAWEQRRYPPEMATDDNGFRIMLRAFGPVICERNTTVYRDMCETLDLNPHDPPTHTFRDQYTFLHETGITDANGEINKKLGHPWTPETIPELDGWVEENSPALDLIGEAVRKPVFCIPISSQDDAGLIAVLLPAVQSSRSIARALNARANYRIATGDIDGAVDDILSCYLLGRRIGEGGLLIELLVGIAIEGIAHAIPVAGNPDHPPTEEQLRRLLDGIEALPKRPEVGDWMEVERFVALDAIQQMSTGKTKVSEMLDLYGTGHPLLAVADRLGYNWNIVAKIANSGCDEIAAGTYTPKYSGVRPTRWLTVRSRSLEMGAILSDLFNPAIDAVKEACRRTDCMARLKRMALALLIYERQHGELPVDDWQDADREILGETDSDFFRCPSSGVSPGETTYVFVRQGPALIVEGLGAVPENTVLDFPADYGSFGSNHTGGYNAAFRDGRVTFCSNVNTIDDFIRLSDPDHKNPVAAPPVGEETGEGEEETPTAE